MSKVYTPISTAEYDATNRSGVVLDIPEGQHYDHLWLVKVTTGTPSAGTMTVRRKAWPGSRAIQTKDINGAASTISLEMEDTMEIWGPLTGIELDIASLGTATAWKAYLIPAD